MLNLYFSYVFYSWSVNFVMEYCTEIKLNYLYCCKRKRANLSYLTPYSIVWNSNSSANIYIYLNIYRNPWNVSTLRCRLQTNCIWKLIISLFDSVQKLNYTKSRGNKKWKKKKKMDSSDRCHSQYDISVAYGYLFALRYTFLT